MATEGNRDAKLDKLIEIVRAKAANPSTNRNGEANRKVILFTLFDLQSIDAVRIIEGRT